MAKNFWLYGVHAVQAALCNPARVVLEVQTTEKDLKISDSIPVKYVSKKQLDALLGKEAVHQGIAALCKPLNPPSVEEICQQADSNTLVIALDQVSDPHNVGAILRSAAAFNVSAVVVPENGSPEENAVLAKTACGGVDVVPFISVKNLVRALEIFKKNGFWCVGLDGYAQQEIATQKLPKKCVLVLGAEGSGLRRLTKENCDIMLRLPISSKMESLNVSNAAAVALYEWNRQMGEKCHF